MKLQYKLSLIGLGLIAMSSCANHDLIPDKTEVGQAVPTTYWEVGSTACKAGESFTFQGKYTVEPGVTPDRAEVWYEIIRQDEASVTATLAGASLAYNKSVSTVETMRTKTSMAVFPHSAAEWNGHEYIIIGEVPVSRTLSPMKWAEIPEWDEERFNSYYPQGFKEEFCEEIINMLTRDSAYYNALRQVYLNYPFANEKVAEANATFGSHLPTNVDLTSDDKGTSEKSDLWFSTTVASDKDIVGYYYKTIDANGNTVIIEVPVDYEAPEGLSIYPVYKSAPWIFCRYDDDLGAIISTVRAADMAAFKSLLTIIPFQDWIYGAPDAGSGNVYKVNFNRKYQLDTDFRVYDTNNNEGIASDHPIISIN